MLNPTAVDKVEVLHYILYVIDPLLRGEDSDAC